MASEIEKEILFRLVFYIRRQRNLNGSFVFNVQAINIYHLFSFSVISQMMGILVRFCYQMLHLLRAPFTLQLFHRATKTNDTRTANDIRQFPCFALFLYK